jgi:hypothetical protein
MHFGGMWCPANSEPAIARTKREMAKFLFNHSTYQVELNEDMLPKLKVHLPPLQAPLAAAQLDCLEQAHSNMDGLFKFLYLKCMDHSQMAGIEHISNGMF